ncbi:MAG: EAL domain-containing protein [Gammaproteobacteria bacterium]|nr:EAL domain-containing protein [Gammaproteobacteria bacterium]
MADYKKEIEAELRKLLKDLKADFSNQKEVSVMQRVMYGLEVHQVEQELQNLEFQRVRADLEQTRDRYAELYDFAPVAYVTFDNQAHITELNLAAAKLLGLDHEHIVNQPISRWLSEKDVQHFLQHLYQVSLSRKKTSTELTLIRENKSEVIVRLESIAVRDADGVATRCQTAILDITDSKRAQQAMHLSQEELAHRVKERTYELERTNRALQQEISQHAKASEKLRQASIVFDNTEDGIIFMDAQFNIVNVNRSFSRITGYAPAELIGETPINLFTSRTDNDQYKTMQMALNGYGHWKGELWYQCKDGEQIPIWENINVVKDETGKISHYVAIVTDITALKETEMRLEHLAHHDALTGLPNRLNYSAILEQAMKRVQRRKKSLALLLLDLDGFKQINDTHGHAAGDTLLKVVAERLQDSIRNEDTVARLGGDEFTVVLEDISQFEDAGLIAEKILYSVAEPIEFEGKMISPTTSIGISVYPDDAEDAENLLRAADAAMYRSKELGGNTYQFFTQDLSELAVESLVLEKQLRNALQEDQFEVYYQPKVTLSDDKIVGMEALLRWNHPERGLLKPDAFISVAEETGLIVEIDDWVLNTACAQVMLWQKLMLAPIRIAINLAGRTLVHNPNIVEQVKSALNATELEPSCLELEIPELALKGSKQCINTLHKLKALGITLSINDFGTGFSSISSLKDLPIDVLKIDRSFVSDIPNNPNDIALASAIIAMGRNLKLKVTAEGVGTAEQLNYLRDLGCDEMQGYLFSRPVSSEGAQNYIEKGKLH